MEEKELELTRKMEAIKQQEAEVENIKFQEKEIKTKLEILEVETKWIVEQRRIVDEHFVILNPTWAFEKEESYMNTLRELNKVMDMKRDLEYNTRKRQLEDLYQRVTEQLRDGTTYLDRLKGQLEKLEKGE